jgi:hypothetical protein
MTLRLPVIILAISLLSIAQFKNHARVKKTYQEEKMKMLDFWLLFQKFLPNGTIILLSLQFESLHQQKGNCVSCSSLLLCTEISVSSVQMICWWQKLTSDKTPSESKERVLCYHQICSG